MSVLHWLFCKIDSPIYSPCLSQLHDTNICIYCRQPHIKGVKRMTKQKQSKASKAVLDATANPNTGVYEVFREIPSRESNGERNGFSYSWTYGTESTPGSARQSSSHSGQWTTFNEIFDRNRDEIAKDLERILTEAIYGKK